MELATRLFVCILFVFGADFALAQSITAYAPVCPGAGVPGSANSCALLNTIAPAVKIERDPREVEAIKIASSKLVDKLADLRAKYLKKEYIKLVACTNHAPKYSQLKLDSEVLLDHTLETLKKMSASTQKEECNGSIDTGKCYLQKNCVSQPWASASDKTIFPILRNEFIKRASTSEDERYERFIKESQQALNPKKDYFYDQYKVMLEEAYDAAKNSIVKGRNPAVLTDSELKKLKDTLSFGLNRSLLVEPRSDKYQKMDVSTLLNEVQSESANISQKPIFCNPHLGALEEDVKGEAPKEPLALSVSTPVSPAEPAFEFCNLSDFFADKLTTLSEQANNELAKCVVDAKTKCGSAGVKEMNATVRSCASTLRVERDGSVPNSIISDQRFESMKSAFESLTVDLKGKAAREDKSIRETYENINPNAASEEEKFTGTCGPRPPKGYGLENWMRPACSVVDQGKSQITSEDDLNCLKNASAKDAWKCNPDKQDVYNAKTTKDVNDYYAKYRYAKVNIKVTCNPELPKQAEVKVNPAVEKKPLACGMKVQCFSVVADLLPAKEIKSNKYGSGVSSSPYRRTVSDEGCPGAQF